MEGDCPLDLNPKPSYSRESVESLDSDVQTQREMNRFPVFPTRSRFPVAYEDLGYIARKGLRG